MAGVLEGLKVVSMERNIAGPLATAYMADWGAEVIRVEPPTEEGSGGERSRPTKGGGIEVNRDFQFRNRNKRSLAVDLKKEGGREILYRLVQKADVFISNYQLSSLKKLRLDYDTLSQLNPRLIYAVVTGYGSKGPDRDEGALDKVAWWARSGIQDIITEAGGTSVQQPPGLGDINVATHVVAGVLGALLHREKTGQGQELELSLLHCGVWSNFKFILNAFSGLPSPKPDRTKEERPIHNVYRTKDDRWLLLSMSGDLYWSGFCQTIEMPELENDPRFNSVEKRRKNCEELIRLLDEIFATKTLAEWDRRCKEHHLVYSRVQTPEEVITDPQALANDFFVDLPHPAGRIKIINSPINFRQNPASVKTPAPELGQDNEEILLDLGYSREDIARLKKQGVLPHESKLVEFKPSTSHVKP